MRKTLMVAVVLLASLSWQGSVSCQVMYDGVMFLGFNMQKDIFAGESGKTVRQAINYAIDRSFVSYNINGDANIPSGIIPLGLPGKNTTINGYPFSKTQAQNLLKNSKIKLTALTLLHTDQPNMVKTAQAIKRNLTDVGVGVVLRQINYEQDDSWEQELSLGKADMFLMQYRITPQPFEKNDPLSRVEKLVFELFHSGGEANMFFLENQELDCLLNMIVQDSSKDTREKEKLLHKVEQIVFDDPVTVNLLYTKEEY